MASILIVGTGQIARAISTPLCDNGMEVILAPARKFVEEPSHHYQASQSSTPLVPVHKLAKIYDSSARIGRMYDFELAIVAVNSRGLERASQIISKNVNPRTPVILLTKGLSAKGGSLQTFPELFGDMLNEHGFANPNVLFLGGPYVAWELSARHHTSVVIAGNLHTARSVTKYIETEYLSVTTSSDISGVSVCAALKNLYALAVGVATGRELDIPRSECELTVRNTAAAIFTQSIKEMRCFTLSVGGDSSTVLGLAGIGDLHVTCGTGRNHRAGVLLSRGLNASDVELVYMPGQTIEGANLARDISRAIDSLFTRQVLDKKDFPLLQFVMNIFIHGRSGEKIPWSAFYNSFKDTRATESGCSA